MIDPGENSYSNPNSVIFYGEKQKKKKNKTKKLLIIGILSILIFISIFVAYFAGLIPINAFLEIKEPVGNSSQVNIDSFFNAFPEFSNKDVLEKFKYGAFLTDASADDVKEDYEKRLEVEGYSFQHYKAEKIMGVNVKTYGYTKGLTGVGIVIFSDSYGLFGERCAVVYTTGNVFDYKNVLEEYGSISGLIA